VFIYNSIRLASLRRHPETEMAWCTPWLYAHSRDQAGHSRQNFCDAIAVWNS